MPRGGGGGGRGRSAKTYPRNKSGLSWSFKTEFFKNNLSAGVSFKYLWGRGGSVTGIKKITVNTVYCSYLLGQVLKTLTYLILTTNL